VSEDKDMNPQEQIGQPVEEIRSRLRALGYLESPVERFLSARTGRASWRAVLGLASRTALLIGVILAALTTSGSLLADPSFIEQPLDILLFFLYLSLAFVSVTFILVLAPALYWARHKRPEQDLRKGGSFGTALLSVGAALVLCVYLTGWWHVMMMESDMIEPVGPVTLTALAIITLVSLGASRLIVMIYFILAGVPEPSHANRAALSRGYALPLAAVLLLEICWAGGIYLNNASDSSLADTIEERSSITRLPMLLVGIDGIDSEMLFNQVENDSLPNLAFLIKEGFSSEIESTENYLAPQVWNTVSTGVTPEDHGVNFFTLPTLRGLSRQPRSPYAAPGLRSVAAHVFPFFALYRPAPLSASTRRSKSIWEILALFRVRSGVVNWWASWPAAHNEGFTVSERTFPKLALVRQEKRASQAYFEEEVYPRAEFDSLSHLSLRLENETPVILEHCPRLTAFLSSGVSSETAELVSSIYRADLFYTRAAMELQSRRKVNFIAIYLQGPDILGRIDERTDLLRPESLRPLIPEYCRYLDYLLGQLLQTCQPTGLTVVVCDPGKRGRQSGRRGAVVFSGIDAKAGMRSGSPFYLEDITPTMLYLMGLPVGRNMAGRVRTEVGMSGPGGPPSLRHIRTYGPPPPVRGQSSPYRYDREMVERLRSLGYVR